MGDRAAWRQNWPDTAWPAPWRADSKPEPTFTVTLSCGCAVAFPAPAPAIGQTLYCRWHGPARVYSTDQPPRCRGKSITGEPCGKTSAPSEGYCWHHSRP